MKLDYYKTYWNSNGKYEENGNFLEGLVPVQGRADDVHVDLYRVAVNMYYDFYNNGGGNDHRWTEFREVVPRFAPDLVDTGEATQDDIDFVLELEGDDYIEDQTQEMVDRLEKVMNAIVIYAYNSIYYGR